MTVDDHTAPWAAKSITWAIDDMANMIAAGYADEVEAVLDQLEVSLLNLGNLVRHLHMRRRSAA